MLACLIFGLFRPFNFNVEYEFSETSAVKFEPVIEEMIVKMDFGSINLSTWEKDYIEGEIIKEAEKEKDLKKIKLEKEKIGSRVKIKVKGKGRIKNARVKVNLKIPEKLKKMETSINAGNLNLNGEKFTCENMDVKINAGSCNLSINNLKIAELGVNINAGNMEIEGEKFSFNNMNIEINAGSGELHTKEISGKNMEIEVNAGNMEIYLPEDENIGIIEKEGVSRVSSDLPIYTKDVDKPFKIKLEVNAGKIEIHKIE